MANTNEAPRAMEQYLSKQRKDKLIQIILLLNEELRALRSVLEWQQVGDE